MLHASAQTSGRGQGGQAARRRRAFSLTELIVVVSIALLLAGMLLPALGHAREAARRVVCSSNLRQLGQGMMLFYDDNGSELPYSHSALEQGNKQELMIARRATAPGGVTEWDGLGELFRLNYCSAGCLYCPSHTGEHTMTRYEGAWLERWQSTKTIYTNYHYAGHLEWDNVDPMHRNVKRRLSEGERLVLATDGLRTQADFNHAVGLNILRGDGSVRWWEDTLGEVTSLLPRSAPGSALVNDPHEERYVDIWGMIKGTE